VLRKKFMKQLIWLVVILTTTTLQAQDVAFKKIIEQQQVDSKLATLTEAEAKESGVLLRNQLLI